MKSFKKLLITAVLALMPTLIFAQTAAFDKYDGQDDVTAVVVTKKMFKMMGDVKNKENQQYLNLISKLDNLRVFTTQSSRVTSDMKATSDKYVKSAGLEELMRVTEKGQNIKILVKSGKSDTNVRELLMFIEGSGKNETVLMSLTGDFDLNDISMLTDKLNLPGGDGLKKASKGAKGSK
ncbi:DUF4252 domain-containing protein [Flavobacterium sp.]|uniref:DUF4252 domain-containing protein n=1 Tax=Flavobacterium sp. TaxID=239 RepID=UPI00121386A1|nr:DUF4252 domain-containing protein [Flavobacterium sp.]RZJ71798.1 MAG: DUF4252 domain-containing protein [Flavobacterium sp.]